MALENDGRWKRLVYYNNERKKKIEIIESNFVLGSGKKNHFLFISACEIYKKKKVDAEQFFLILKSFPL